MTVAWSLSFCLVDAILHVYRVMEEPLSLYCLPHRDQLISSMNGTMRFNIVKMSEHYLGNLFPFIPMLNDFHTMVLLPGSLSTVLTSAPV